MTRLVVPSSADLDDLARLEAAVVAADGGRLKTEWRVVREGQVPMALHREDGELLGFAGLYRFGGPAEVTGAVLPAARRRGLGGALLDAVQAAAGRVLLVVPRQSVGGAALARRRQGQLEHSEHALLLDGAPAGQPDLDLAVRLARPADAERLADLLTRAFGHVLRGGDLERTLVAEQDGQVVGCVRLELSSDEMGGVYGLAVEERLRGRGIGTTLLHAACARLREQGARQLGLEVAVENDRALGLYLALGFRQVATEDYWALPG